MVLSQRRFWDFLFNIQPCGAWEQILRESSCTAQEEQEEAGQENKSTRWTITLLLLREMRTKSAVTLTILRQLRTIKKKERAHPAVSMSEGQKDRIAAQCRRVHPPSTPCTKLNTKKRKKLPWKQFGQSLLLTLEARR